MKKAAILKQANKQDSFVLFRIINEDKPPGVGSIWVCAERFVFEKRN